MISAALLSVLALARASQAFPPDPVLEVRGARGFELVEPLAMGRGQLFAVPLSCRSERVARAAPARDGIAFRLFGVRGFTLSTARVRAVRHLAGEQVLIADGTALLAGEPVLPVRVQAEGGDLATLARQDDNVIEGGRVVLEAPEAPGALVLIGAGAVGRVGWPVRANGGARELPARERRACVIRDPGARIELALGEARLDQAFFADVRGVQETRDLALRDARSFAAAEASPYRRHGVGPWLPRIEAIGDATPCELNALGAKGGHALELRFDAPPRAGEGETWTLLVELELAFAEDGSASGKRAAEASTPAAKPGPFRDVARSAGLDAVHLEGPDEQLDIRPTMGPGAAWGDVDGDGRVDLYLVQGGGRAGSAPLPNRLFRNRGDGTFADVTAESSVGDTGAGMGALFFDADGDSDLDLYVANYGADVLYLNDGEGRFADVSARAGVGGDIWSASVCASDVDEDGDLDLYVTSYIDFDLEKMPPAAELGRYQREDPVPMLPFAFPGQRNTFLRNDSTPEGVRFTDVTEELGLADAEGRGMQAIFWDFDRDGDDDLYVANDVSFNVLFRNEGDGRFADVSFAIGLDDPRGGMGLAVGDVDRDGDEDLFLTNWELEANALYQSDVISAFTTKHRRSSFRDATVRSGLGPAGIGATSWGAVFFDAENDADLDLFVANGYTSPDYESTGICVGQPNHFFENRGEGRFRDATGDAGPDLAVELASRCAVACDYDQDGRVDVLVTANNGRPQLLRNEHEKTGHWLAVRLRSKTGNTFGIGAEVTVRAGKETWRRSLRAGTGYLGGNPPELHFGLGDVTEIEEVEVRWPSGEVTRHADVVLDGFVTLQDG